jgi:predicted permease
VVGQIALALALLTCSGLLVRSLMLISSVDPGFDHERALLAELELPASSYETDAELIAYWRTALARLEALPGVEAVGLTRGAPLESFIPNGTIYLDEERTEGYAWYGVVSAGYFAALDIPLLQGRLFENSDTVDSPHVAVINRAAAEAFWPGGDPIGRTVRWGGMDVYGDAPLRIVGVVGDAREQSLTNAPTPTVYSNFYQRPARARDGDAVLRSAAPGELVSTVRKELGALDASVPVRFHRLVDSYSGALAKPRFGASLIGFFAVCATLLSAVGLFSAMAYAVSLRTREWGVRLAVGATAGQVRGQVMREALATAGAGGALGLALAVIGGRALETQLFGVSAMDPASFAAAAAVIVAAALAAAWLPARKASATPPMDALRQE